MYVDYNKSKMEEIFTTLQAFIAKQSGRRTFPIEHSTAIEKDLGIAGDDAVDFILAYSKKFNVDVSKFMLADYFNGEGLDLIGTSKQKKSKELTVRDLEKGIIAGKLDEDIISG